MSARCTDTVVVHAFGRHVVAFAMSFTPEEKAGVLKLAEKLAGWGVEINFV